MFLISAYNDKQRQPVWDQEPDKSYTQIGWRLLESKNLHAELFLRNREIEIRNKLISTV